MRFLKNKKTYFILATIALLSIEKGYSQSSNLTVEQDPVIEKLVKIKKELGYSDNIEKIYKIQIYNGTREGAKKAVEEFKKEFTELAFEIAFENPNYKVRIGKFRNKLEADKNLIEIRKTYPGAFILSPKK